MLARDQSVPEQTTTARVKITINRDKYAPRFKSSKYTISLPEVTSVPSNITTSQGVISASDRDEKADMKVGV